LKFSAVPSFSSKHPFANEIRLLTLSSVSTNSCPYFPSSTSKLSALPKHQFQIAQSQAKVICCLLQQPVAILARRESHIEMHHELCRKQPDFYQGEVLADTSLIKTLERGIHSATFSQQIHSGHLPKGPMENGAKPSLCLIISGREYQRSGTKDVQSV
jgi:hypothetical protein